MFYFWLQKHFWAYYKACLSQAKRHNSRSQLLLNKLGGRRETVQINETMLIYKFKSHRGGPPNNRTDALYIIEFGDKLEILCGKLINDKTKKTLLPIIHYTVCPNTRIMT